MKTEKDKLFLTLLKLKSYLVSMIDEPGDHYSNLKMTAQYLDIKYPARRKEIIELLENNNIYSDSEIAFDGNIVFKFREIAHNPTNKPGLTSLLSDLEIDAKNFTQNETDQNNVSIEREKRLSEILYILFKLATHWQVLKDLEEKADSFSILNDEDLMRPEEEKNLGDLDDSTAKTYNTISLLTDKYIELLTKYYFSYGENSTLKDFVDTLDKTKKSVAKKYFDLS
jgi:hypothetical protein